MIYAFDVTLNAVLLGVALLVPYLLWRARREGARRTGEITQMRMRLAISLGRLEIETWRASGRVWQDAAGGNSTVPPPPPPPT